MLNVVIAPPPVPHVSTSSPGRAVVSAVIALAERARRAGQLVGGLALHAQAHEERAELRAGALPRHHRVERGGRLLGGQRFAGGDPAQRGQERRR